MFEHLDIKSGSFEGQELADRSSRCQSPPVLLNNIFIYCFVNY